MLLVVRAPLLVFVCASCDLVLPLEEHESKQCTTADPFRMLDKLPMTDPPVSRGGARLSRDERTLLFHAVVDGTLTLRIAERAGIDEPFGPSRILSSTVQNNAVNPTFDDRDYVIYEILFAGTIFVIQRQGDGYGEPIALANVRDHSPFVVDDTLWFSSQGRAAAIYSAPLTADGTFAGPPVAQPEVVPTNGGLVISPVVSRDGLTMFYAQLPPFSGNADLWMMTRSATDEPFANALSLDTINTGFAEYPGWLSDDGCRLYFSSDRAMGDDFELYIAGR